MPRCGYSDGGQRDAAVSGAGLGRESSGCDAECEYSDSQSREFFAGGDSQSGNRREQDRVWGIGRGSDSTQGAKRGRIFRKIRRKKRQSLFCGERQSPFCSAVCGARSFHRPMAAMQNSMAALARNRLRMPAVCATGPEPSIAMTCEEASADIRLLLTRPNIAGGVSCCRSVCEVIMMKAAKKPSPSMPMAVVANWPKSAVMKTAPPI